MAKHPFSLKKRISSFKHAYDGLIHLFREEHNSWIHVLAMLVVVAAGFIFHLSTLEWILVCLAIGVVFTAEVINTAIERIVDLISPGIHPLAKQAKDLGAAAVLVTAATAVVIAVLIFGPKIFPPKENFTNSVGMEMIRISPGQFQMGQANGGEWDEKPVHSVTLTQSFYISTTEVTNAQFESFQPGHRELRGKKGLSIGDSEAVVNVSWADAVAYCKWLSEKEGKLYRLPTEAEWEYVCRAGTQTAFSTGFTLPECYFRNQKEEWTDQIVDLTVGITPPNPWGIYDMHGNVEEWCLDWYGSYPDAEVKNPLGPIEGDFRVSRGGSHNTPVFYLRSANRSGSLPGDRSVMIGFRVVCGKLPAGTNTKPNPPLLWQQNVSETPSQPNSQPVAHTPVFDDPIPYVKIPVEAKGPLYTKHNHCPALTVCPNGDLLAIWYTCETESGRELALAASRLRKGQESWDPADLFWDAPDRNDHASDLIVDHQAGIIHHFNGLSSDATWGKLALIHRTSSNNGQSWSPAEILNPEHGLMNQPIAGGFISSDGQVVLKSDAVSTSHGGTVLHLGRTDSKNWIIPDLNAPKPDFQKDRSGSRIAGIHAGVVELRDGYWLALGRGDTIQGKMPQSLSRDRGKSWTYSSSVFPSIGSGQRLVLMRLQEGPILLVSFCNVDWDELRLKDSHGKLHFQHGMFAALSYDEGKTWPVKKLLTPGGEALRLNGGAWTQEFTLSQTEAEPKGYLDAEQDLDGMIHLLSSGIYYRFNLEWLKSRNAD